MIIDSKFAIQQINQTMMKVLQNAQDMQINLAKKIVKLSVCDEQLKNCNVNEDKGKNLDILG